MQGFREDLREVPESVFLRCKPSIEPSWEGHTFSGWQIRGYNTLYQPGQVIQNIYSDITFYAVWDEDPSSFATPTLPQKEEEVLSKILLKKLDYPEGSEFSPDCYYKWKYAHIFIGCHGASAFCAILSDAGFGEGSKVEPISFGISRHNFKIGDIIEWDSLNKIGIILAVDYEYFTIAEANDGIVHWDTKLPRSTSIGHIDCRW